MSVMQSSINKQISVTEQQQQQRPHKRTIQETITTRVHKRLRLTTKQIGQSSSTTVTGTSIGVFTKRLENCTNSNDALQILMQISDILQYNDGNIMDSIKRLTEHYRIEKESAVRVKILALLAELSYIEQHHQQQLQQQQQQSNLQSQSHQQSQSQQQHAITTSQSQALVKTQQPSTTQQQHIDGTMIVDEIITLLQGEESPKVLSQGLHSLFKIGTHCQFIMVTITKIVQFSKTQLTSISHNVQRHALLLLGQFCPIADDHEIRSTLDLISQYINSPDPRVRAQAFSSILILGQRGVNLTPTLYTRTLNGLHDDYECVRKEALQLIYELGLKHPDHMVEVPNASSKLRLIDAAFTWVCSALCDLSTHVRTQAAELLGGMTSVSNEFLHQTLDKKLMSDLRRKRTMHERYTELYQSGEWATGRKWADDNPKELIDIDTVSLMASGACGALVHGLEDEFLEVRTAAVDSMCRLALKNPPFAVTSLDFLVDMFNDEIESVRLRAIFSLTAISKHIILREDQLETMLGSLEDFSVEVREGLHLMLGACKVATQACLLLVVRKVLDVLAKYPQDKLSAFGCFKRVGNKHPELCMSLVAQLLEDHPFFDRSERDVEDPSYVCKLIMLFNAAQLMPPMLSLLPETTVKHYAYLRDTMPNFVPYLPIGGVPKQLTLTNDMTTGSRQFLETLLQNVEAAYKAPRARQALLTAAQDNLARLAAIDPELSGTAHYTATFLGAQLIIEQLQSALILPNSRTPSKECLNLLLKKCLKLQNLFSGLTLTDQLMVKQISLRASALHLVLVVKDRSQSALGPCQLLLHIASDTQTFLMENVDMKPDAFTQSILTQIANVSDPKPGRIFREILPIVQMAPPLFTPHINVNIKICSATIVEPSDITADTIVKVTASLIAALSLVADINNLQQNQRQDLRLRIKYPDQNVHLVVPRLRDLKRILTESGTEEDNNWRLRTTVLLSHGVWTEAAQVEISICLSVRPGHELELCKPIKVYFAPKPVKRGI